MVFTAAEATTFTNNAISVQDGFALQGEVDLTERAIRNAANRQQFSVLFDARVIGNPIGDVTDNNLLTALQEAYRDTFVNAGYLVSLDADSGLWRLSWDDTDIDSLVSVYSIRTTVIPGAIADQTIALIDSYFDGLAPAATSTTRQVLNDTSGDTDEDDFGAAISTFYEYVAVVRQQEAGTDLSAGLRSTLVGSGLGYVNAPSNIAVYKIA